MGKGDGKMELTSDVRDTLVERAREDAGFRVSLLKEAVESILAGELEPASG